MDLSTAKQLLEDLEVASRSLVLMGSLHLLYLVTPHDAAGIRPDYRHYYSLVRFNLTYTSIKISCQNTMNSIGRSFGRVSLEYCCLLLICLCESSYHRVLNSIASSMVEFSLKCMYLCTYTYLNVSVL